MLNWAKLQQKYGCKYIYTVNFNDTPSSQVKFYQRMKKAGMKFSIIELGYQQYLPKYTEYKTCRYDEVTRRTLGMTPAKYIKMCREYISLFKTSAGSFYIQFAPEYSSSRKSYKEWNDYMASGIKNNKFGNVKIYGSIQSGSETDTLQLINSLKKMQYSLRFLTNQTIK